jgi:TnpA family transposase
MKELIFEIPHFGALGKNTQLKEPFTNFWGDGTTSSSYGMRVNTIDSIDAGFSHKPGLKKIITLHKFLNDKYSTFFVTASSPGDRDGIHVIDGLTRHRSKLNIKEHYTDTAGYTNLTLMKDLKVKDA